MYELCAWLERLASKPLTLTLATLSSNFILNAQVVNQSEFLPPFTDKSR